MKISKNQIDIFKRDYRRKKEKEREQG